MACMLYAESKWAYGLMHGEDNKMLDIAERVTRALEGQKEALEAQWEILTEMQDFMKQMARYQKSVAVNTLWIIWELEQEGEKEEQNKEVEDSGKGRNGGNGENVEGGADAEMADVWARAPSSAKIIFYFVFYHEHYHLE